MRFLTMDFFLSLMITFFVAGILSQILIGVLYQRMIEEAENMQDTENKLLIQLKQKYMVSYTMNEGAVNVSAFVDKFINRIQIGKMSLNTIKNFSGQSMLLSVVSAGVGICKGLMNGKSFFSLVPYYGIIFMGLYLYFSVLSIVDIPARKNTLKINLVEYFENQAVQSHRDILSKVKITEPISEPEKEEAFARIRMPHAESEVSDTEPEKAFNESKSSPRDLDWTKTEAGQESTYLNEEQEKELARLLKDLLS